MGVPGLWSIIESAKRPTKLTTLNRKRLAVDASIWIYQFLKAVRDKEGNALRNSHVVGFFRRICKLLFHGILPVFVFDGGAPVLKRETINARRRRREGRREDAAKVAGRMLAVQMHRLAEKEEEERKERNKRGERRKRNEEEEVPDEADLVYVEELGLSKDQRQQARVGFKKKDQYHLPDMTSDFSQMGAPGDPRIMTAEELQEYAQQFHSGEDVSFYDFAKIDFDGPFFMSLPAADRYNILNTERLRSRLRMGYSKEQLDGMYPQRMDFSKFQVARAVQRNELTQRLMNVNGMNKDQFNVNSRVAGEKGKEYVLVKNDGAEGGYSLGVVSNKSGEGTMRNKPIDVDNLPGSSQVKGQEEEDEWEDEDAFEDVPIEGLNRLPKLPAAARELDTTDDAERREELYAKRMAAAGQGRANDHVTDTRTTKHSIGRKNQNLDSLFVEQASDEEMDELFEDVMPEAPNEDDLELQRAIAMSLEQEQSEDEQTHGNAVLFNGPDITKPLDFNQKNAKFGRAVAQATNARANGEFSGAFAEDSDDEDAQHLSSGPKGFARREDKAPAKETPSPPKPNNHGFDGPLPFESLNLGKSIFGKKKKKEDESGGFEKEKEEKKDKAEPLPPWFSADLKESIAAQQVVEDKDREAIREEAERLRPMASVPALHRFPTKEVIDLEAPRSQGKEVIEVESSDEDKDENVEEEEGQEEDADEEEGIETTSRRINNGVHMDDLAVKTRAEPPQTTIPNNIPQQMQDNAAEGQSVREEVADDEIEWSESDLEDEDERRNKARETVKPAGGEIRLNRASSTPEFEDIDISPQRKKGSSKFPSLEFQDVDLPPTNGGEKSPILQPEDVPMQDQSDRQPGNSTPPPLQRDETIGDAQEFDEFSDPEDELLMAQLAQEAEEHARFASSIATHTHTYTAEDYEAELKQLRNQQKRDRRDADEVTQVMITECQQLLKLFGLPYITAPMEAEAQCAKLVSLGLVDGIVTDDSDIFLFGGTRVYKNMFSKEKFVECYLASDIESAFSLTRERVIQLAHLLGSDYTEGLPHVGPVAATEILAEFSSLKDFAEWFNAEQEGRSAPDADAKNPWRKKFRKNTTKIFLPPSFPDPRVDQAYLQPDVDSDPSAFQWGVPDLDALRKYLMATVGWSQERADEILVPVIKDMNKREVEGTQANITRFFGGQVGSGTVVPRRPGAGGPRGFNAGAGDVGGADDDFEGDDEAAAAPEREGFAPRVRTAGKSSRLETALGKLHARAQAQSRGEEVGADAGADEEPVQPARPRKKAMGSDKTAKTRAALAQKRGRKRKAASAEAEDVSADGSLRRNESDDPDESREDGGVSSEEYAPPKKASKRGKGKGRGTKA